MSDARLPAHLEVAGLIRAVESAGGFATVLQRGEPEAGSVLVLTMHRGENARLWERLPRLDGRRIYSIIRTQDADNAGDFDAYRVRRQDSDPDAWVVELDVPEPERFIDCREP